VKYNDCHGDEALASSGMETKLIDDARTQTQVPLFTLEELYGVLARHTLLTINDVTYRIEFDLTTAIQSRLASPCKQKEMAEETTPKPSLQEFCLFSLGMHQSNQSLGYS